MHWPSTRSQKYRLSRTAAVLLGIVLLHIAAGLGLYSGLLQRAGPSLATVVPVSVVFEAGEPAPVIPTLPAAPTAMPHPPPAPTTPPAPPAPPVPRALAQPTPEAAVVSAAPEGAAPSAATATAAVQSTTTAVAASPTSTSAALTSATPPPSPKVKLPSSVADYLDNPKPAYPRRSWQLREQGSVLIRVLIGTDGLAHKAEIKVSSGYPRLDEAALSSVRAWRYVPGTIDGVPQTMWFDVPINFVWSE